MTITIIKNNVHQYNNAILQDIPMFVKFYSKDCGACIAMQQEWNKFVKHLKNEEIYLMTTNKF